MKKIPTLFRRDPDNLRHVLPEVTPGCEWVIAGEGVATRKYDGTCLWLDEHGGWWARREVKPGKEPPATFVEVDHDPVTDKRVGWELLEQTGWGKYVAEAIANSGQLLEAGTYELCGPKVNRNPESFEHHSLVRHGLIQLDYAPRTFDALRTYLLAHTFEGVVWHHPDGRMCKLKARDFR